MIETIQRDGSQAKSLRQSDVTDTVFHASDLSGVPTDLELTAEFSTGEGNSFAVHGFVNDSGELVVRFTPPTEGACQYSTCSTLDQLAGIHGKLMAGAPRVGLVIDADRSTRFRYEDGESC